MGVSSRDAPLRNIINPLFYHVIIKVRPDGAVIRGSDSIPALCLPRPMSAGTAHHA